MPPHFSEAESAALLKRISDQESGHPRQWLLLEMASTLPEAHTSTRVRIASLLARCLGIPSLYKIGKWLNLPGLPPYASAAQAVGLAYSRGLNDAALWLVTLDALLAASQRLPASHQFTAWPLWIIGGAIKLWRFSRRHPNIPAPEPSGEEILPGAESALGLQGLLLAHGIAPQPSQALLTNLKKRGDVALPALLEVMPELSRTATHKELYRALLLGWSLPLLPAFWIEAWRWGWLLMLLWCLLLNWLAHRRLTQTLLLLACAAGSFALVSLLRWF